MAYIRGSNPIWSFVDLTGRQFDDTYYMFVLENDLPYIPATVYQTPDGTPWTNPIQFLANGTLPDNIYFDPGTDTDPIVYRLEFRQGNTQADPLIYLVENYIPGVGTGDLPDIGFTTDNQITNAQFSVVNFYNPTTITSASNLSLQFAPGWTLDLTASGTGTVTLTQQKFNNTTQSSSNASYGIEINISGWGAAVLKQRFNGNGMLWANKQVSCAVTAEIASGANANISAQVIDSNATVLGQVLPLTTVTGMLQEYTGHALFPASTNPNTPPAAYIEFQVILPTTVDIVLTSFQLVAGDLPLEYSYEQDTIERQIDHTFHYWQPDLNFKPISSYLVGWDFIVNPMQFFNATAQAVGANKSYYAFDQTIFFQTANSAFTFLQNDKGFIDISAAATSQLAIIQYLDSAVANDIFYDALINGLSVFLEVGASVAQKFTVSLWFNNNTIGTGMTTNDSLVTALDANGYPTVSSGWTEIKLATLDKAQGTLSGGTAINQNAFANFMNSNAYVNGESFAIVIGTDSITMGNSIVLKSISLVPGGIATPPAPQTEDEVLRECQYYYETSFAPGNGITATKVNSRFAPATASGAGTVNLKSLSFSLNYLVPKRIAPGALTLYSGVSTTSNKILGNINLSSGVQSAEGNLSDGWTLNNNDPQTAIFIKNSTNTITSTSTAGTLYDAYITYQYTADARLGLY